MNWFKRKYREKFIQLDNFSLHGISSWDVMLYINKTEEKINANEKILHRYEMGRCYLYTDSRNKKTIELFEKSKVEQIK